MCNDKHVQSSYFRGEFQLLKLLSQPTQRVGVLNANKLLFGLLQRMNLVEKAGTGILRIRNAMKEYKLEKPKIETDENWFTIIF